jgi:putative DNA primase/helicase
METISHSEITEKALSLINLVNFKVLASLDPKEKLQRKHYVVFGINELLRVMLANGWDMCMQNGFAYIYNGAYWKKIGDAELCKFLGDALHRMGVRYVDANHYQYKEELYEQFKSTALPPRVIENNEVTLINLQNGTFEISSTSQRLSRPNSLDFLKYQLPFKYDEAASALMFEKYLNTALPDVEAQKVLAEYAGYVFIKHGNFKLEKSLMITGSGSNGKSVFFEIMSAMLGKENITNFSLEKITSHDYSRAMLDGKLLNYCSDIGTKLDTAVFKQMVSGEPVEARLPFGKPFTLVNYAKLLFNCNTLPQNVEHNEAFFKRLIIVPFNNTIPLEEQDPSLPLKIIDQELSGVFNWVMGGLKRLIKQGKFTHCKLIEDFVQQYRRESNNVQLFLDDSYLQKSANQKIDLRELYQSYSLFCKDYGYKPLSKINFKKRMINMEISVENTAYGEVARLVSNIPKPLPLAHPTIVKPDDSVTEILNKIVKKGTASSKPLF